MTTVTHNSDEYDYRHDQRMKVVLDGDVYKHSVFGVKAYNTEDNKEYITEFKAGTEVEWRKNGGSYETLYILYIYDLKFLL